MILNVKSLFDSMRDLMRDTLLDSLRALTLTAAVAATGFLGACGQKGPLFMPAKPPQPDASVAKPAQTTPTPETVPASKQP